MKLSYYGAALALAYILSPSLALAQKTQSADFIVAVVNSEPITNSEFQSALNRAIQQLQQQKQPLPPTTQLRNDILERLITERAQLQLAKEQGIRVDKAAIDQAEAALAQQNQTNAQGLRKLLAQQGIDERSFRQQLSDQILLTRLHEREIEARVRVSEDDINRFLQDQQNKNNDPATQQINLAQILIALPERATPEQTAQLAQQAQSVLARLRAGESFENLVKTVSQGDRSNAGALGLRTPERYPQAFVNATQKLPIGAISDVITSGAGFHILKVLDRQNSNPLSSIPQTRVSHILLLPNNSTPQATLISRLNELKQRIQANKISFAGAAREVSQDGSAPAGGDLGWVNPGALVPEFETAMNQLPLNAISDPVVSRFGVHLIQVLERKKAELKPNEIRELARNQLRQTKLQETYTKWIGELRERAFVELRDAPL